MNRIEAMTILGLSDPTTEKEINTAYFALKETLDPERFTENKRVARQAAEVLKKATDARDVLVTKSSRKDKWADFVEKPEDTPFTEKVKLETKIAAYERARIIFTGYLGSAAESRRRAIIAILVAVVVGFLTVRFLKFTSRLVGMVIAMTVSVYSLIVIQSTTSRISVLKGQIEDIVDLKDAAEKRLNEINEK